MMLSLARIDQKRRNFQIKLLYDFLTVNFYDKDSISIRMPSFNVADPATMTSWLDLRRLVANMGMRFK